MTSDGAFHVVHRGQIRKMNLDNSLNILYLGFLSYMREEPPLSPKPPRIIFWRVGPLLGEASPARWVF